MGQPAQMTKSSLKEFVPLCLIGIKGAFAPHYTLLHRV